MIYIVGVEEQELKQFCSCARCRYMERFKVDARCLPPSDLYTQAGALHGPGDHRLDYSKEFICSGNPLSLLTEHWDCKHPSGFLFCFDFGVLRQGLST